MALQAQWNLDTTSDSFLTIAKGLLRAASSDNVQPLAILACERFGNTIAMSQETCRIVEMNVVPTPAPAPIQFLKATVGYSADDCATQLSKSQAGIHFLGLASAMVTTMGEYAGGLALHEMLKSAAADKSLLPTVQQLKDLLASLKPRCQYSGFANNVLGWEVFFGKALSGKPGYFNWSAMPEDRYELFDQFVRLPSDKGVKDLVEAFRQLSRLGESTVTRVTIKAHFLHTPWLVAFVKWCCGIPPLVFLENNVSILVQPDSRVTVIACSDTGYWGNTNFEVNIQHSISNLSQLLVSQSGTEWAGMVGIPAYGKWFLQKHGFGGDLSFRALEHALPYALKQVVSLMKVHSHLEYLTTRPFLEFELSPFQDDRAISSIASLFLNKDAPLELKALDNGLLVRDLPLVKLHLESLEPSCRCADCGGTHNSAGCLKYHFWVYFGLAVSTILSLSLFHCPENMLIRMESHSRVAQLAFSSHINNIIKRGGEVVCVLELLLESALVQVGHEISDILGNRTAMGALLDRWVISSYKGQTVFPTIFETHTIPKRGFFALTWYPGLLKHNGSTYSLARTTTSAKRSRTNSKREHDVISEASDRTVASPCNLAPTLRLVWDVQVANEFLEVSLGLLSTAGETIPSIRSPAQLFHNLTRSLMLESCSHDHNRQLDPADPFCGYTGPVEPLSKPVAYTEGPSDHVGVVAVDGADDLRMFTMCCSPHYLSDLKWLMVLRGSNACLKCCLDLCRRADAKILIL